MDVALHRPDHDLADSLRACLGEKRPEDLHARLHGVCGEQHLGDEEDAVPEIDAHDAHPLDEGVIEHRLGIPAPSEQDLRPLDDLIGKTVVEVVVHLVHQIRVGK